jgi:DNA-binding HxlR family transcriptional regulator
MKKTDLILELVDRGVTTNSQIRDHIPEITRGSLSGLLTGLVKKGLLSATGGWKKTYYVTPLGAARLNYAKLQRPEKKRVGDPDQLFLLGKDYRQNEYASH